MRVEPSMDVRGSRRRASGAGLQASASCFRKPGSGTGLSNRYIFIIVNVPLPVQPPLPVSVHAPEIVLPLVVPESASVLPVGDPDSTVKPNFPFAVPLKFPLSVKEPLSVSPETKHGEFALNWKLEMLSEPSPLTVNEVPKSKTDELPPLINVAFHVPLMLEGFVLFEPQPISARLINTTNITANRFMRIPPG